MNLESYLDNDVYVYYSHTGISIVLLSVIAYNAYKSEYLRYSQLLFKLGKSYISNYWNKDKEPKKLVGSLNYITTCAGDYIYSPVDPYISEILRRCKLYLLNADGKEVLLNPPHTSLPFLLSDNFILTHCFKLSVDHDKYIQIIKSRDLETLMKKIVTIMDTYNKKFMNVEEEDEEKEPSEDKFEEDESTVNSL